MPEWLVERGIGETRAVLIEDDEIVEARILLDGVVPYGSVIEAKLLGAGTPAVAIADGQDYLLPKGSGGATEGARIKIRVTRERIPGTEPWKRPLAQLTEADPVEGSVAEGQVLPFPHSSDVLEAHGWSDLVEEARSGIVRFAGGELRVSPTPAMTLIDVDGTLAPADLAIAGAGAAAIAIRRLSIGGSIGIDLPTARDRKARQAAANAIDQRLPQPFERTAINGFGFVQIVRPRTRPSLLDLAADPAVFEARALLRRAALDAPGPTRIAAHPAVIAVLARRPEWLEQLARQVGGAVSLRADPSLPMSGGYAEPA